MSAVDQLTAARLPDGRIICAGGSDIDVRALSSVERCEPLASGALDAAWTWRELLAMSVARDGCRGCVLTARLSDGRFAVLGGDDGNGEPLSSCEALIVDHDAHWEVLPSMLVARSYFVCALLAECVAAAGGAGRTPNGTRTLLRSAEVFDEVFSVAGGCSLRVICPTTTGCVVWDARYSDSSSVCNRIARTNARGCSEATDTLRSQFN